MALESILREAVGDTIAEDVLEIVANKTRRVMRERKDELTTIIRAAVTRALAEALTPQDSEGR
jgi:hypothetical protein